MAKQKKAASVPVKKTVTSSSATRREKRTETTHQGSGAPSQAAQTISDASKSPIGKSPVPHIAAVSNLSASVKVLELGAGLYLLGLGECGGSVTKGPGVLLPATYVAGAPAGQIEVFGGATGPGDWLGPEGGSIVVRIPAGGGHIWITTYRRSDHDAVPIEIQVTRLNQSAPKASRTATSAAAAAGVGQSEQNGVSKAGAHEIKTEVLVHVERLGDRLFPGGGWIGNRGQRRRIEAFGIRPLEFLSPQEIEYKAFGPQGRETPWVTDGKLCGTRGQGMPLTGFAIRLAPHARENYDVYYEGAFFEGGASPPAANGDRCMSTKPDDPLEDINVRLVPRKAP